MVVLCQNWFVIAYKSPGSLKSNPHIVFLFKNQEYPYSIFLPPLYQNQVFLRGTFIKQ